MPAPAITGSRRPFGRLAAVAVLLFSPWLLPAPAAAQHRSKLQNQEAEWSSHPYRAGTVAIVFSRDGKRVVSVARVGDLLRVLDPGKAPNELPQPPAVPAAAAQPKAAADPGGERPPADGPALTQVLPGTPLISADSEHVVYAGRVAASGDWVVVHDGKPSVGYARVWRVVQSTRPGPHHVAYVAEGHNGKPFVMFDDVAHRAYDGIDEASLVLSPDGSRVAYAAHRDGQWYVVTDQGEGLAYASVGRPVFSGNGARVGHVARRVGKDVVVVDGREVAVRDDVIQRGSLALSYDGNRYAFAAAPEGGPCSVLVGGGANGPFLGAAVAVGRAADMVPDGAIAFSPDGTRVAWAALRDGRWFVAVDGVEGGGHDGLRPWPPAFSPDGRRVAYVAERVNGDRPEQYVVDDGVAGRAYRRVLAPPVYSADSRHLAYVADRGDARVTVVDQLEGKPYPFVRGHPVLSADGSRVGYLALPIDARFAAVEEVPYDPAAGVAGGGRLVVDRSSAYGWLPAIEQNKPIRLLAVEERVVQE